jgi:serine/threonine protein kinase, bacterial
MQMAERLNNRYEITRELGDGGFGKTYLVRDCQMPSARECVLKQLKPVHNDAQMYDVVKTRFQREAAILENLGEHDQIPRLYAYFSEADRFYLVEEYVEGDTLTQKVQREGPQSEKMVRSMLVNLLPAMVHVHQQKIVHRDIKPDNIILRKSDGKPVLLDFGAVKETMTTVMNQQGASTHSIVVGTPGYMPAEQLAGRPVYSSDLYSLGLTAIYMLTGKMPQEMDSDPGTGAILWSGYAPNVSDGFAALLDRAIQLNPGSRFSTAQEMFMALNALAIGVTMDPSGVWPQGQPQGGHSQGMSSATVVSAAPGYSSGMPTQVVAPQMASQSYAQPPQAQPPSQSYSTPSTGGEWKKAAMTGGIIGLSILIGAMVLKTQNQPAPVANSGTASPAPSVAASASATPAVGASSSPKVEAPAAPAESAPTKTLVSAEAAAAAAAGTDATIVGEAGSKNIRSGPGTKYDSPHVAYPGDRVKVLATSRDEGGYTWSKVYFPKSGADGWIAAQLLRADGGRDIPMESAPVSTPAKPAKPSASTAETNATIVGESGSKNIRSGPGTSYDSPHTAYPGDRVKIVDSAQDKGGFTWYKVYFPKSGADGWIAAQLIRVD